jgi:hypothetical protein
VTNVSPGAYDVNFQLQGFRPATYTGVNVSSGMETIFNTTMEVGSISEAVTVTGGVGHRGRRWRRRTRRDEAVAAGRALSTAFLPAR